MIYVNWPWKGQVFGSFWTLFKRFLISVYHPFFKVCALGRFGENLISPSSAALLCYFCLLGRREFTYDRINWHQHLSHKMELYVRQTNTSHLCSLSDKLKISFPRLATFCFFYEVKFIHLLFIDNSLLQIGQDFILKFRLTIFPYHFSRRYYLFTTFVGVLILPGCKTAYWDPICNL